jgi:hypothetical protein
MSARKVIRSIVYGKTVNAIRYVNILRPFAAEGFSRKILEHFTESRKFWPPRNYSWSLVAMFASFSTLWLSSVGKFKAKVQGGSNMTGTICV